MLVKNTLVIIPLRVLPLVCIHRDVSVCQVPSRHTHVRTHTHTNIHTHVYIYFCFLAAVLHSIHARKACSSI